jgi:hypothetical protein
MRRTAILAGCAAAFLAVAAHAQGPALKPVLAGLSFLVGDWTSGKGKIADTGGTSTGRSRFEPAAGGAVLLRRDHTNLFDASGAPAGGFDQIMMIYPEAGTLHADYSDGDHVIHYVTASVEPGKSVIFTSEAKSGAPTFRLAYALEDSGTLSVSFSMAQPGSGEFRPIATGTLEKAALPTAAP